MNSVFQTNSQIYTLYVFRIKTREFFIMGTQKGEFSVIHDTKLKQTIIRQHTDSISIELTPLISPDRLLIPIVD